MFTTTIRVRAYECDSLGHVNNAVYLGYMQQATLDALGIRDSILPVPAWRRLAIEYATPARYGDELSLSTWSAPAEPSHWRGYEIIRAADQARVLRAQVQWAIAPARAEDAAPLPLKSFHPAQDNGARPWFWHHRVARYELDASGGAAFASYFNWLEEATFRTAHVSGWTMERLRAENFITLQYRHDADFLAPARNGDEIEISSRLVEVRRVRGTWLHEIRRVNDQTLLLRDYSTGAFLDWQGNVRAAPAGMMERLVQGSSPAPDLHGEAGPETTLAT